MSAAKGRPSEDPASSPTPTSAPTDVDYPVQPVPPSARRSFLSLTIVLVGFTLFTPTMLAGAQIGAAFPFWPLVGVLLLGTAILGVYVCIIGWIGAHTKLTTVMMARYAFGTRGAKLASLLLGGSQVGWYGVTVATLALVTAQALGIESDTVIRILMVLGAALMAITAYIGYRGMYWLSVVSVPLLVILSVWVAIRSFAEVGGSAGLGAVVPQETMSLTVAITVIVGTFASGGTQAPNWTRFARRPSAGLWSCFAAFVIGQLLMLFCGAVGAFAFGEGDFVLVLFQMGLVGWGLVFLIANLWTTNDSTAYNFGVAGAELFNSPSRKPWVIGGVILGTALAVTGIYDNLLGFLEWLGVLIPPLGGVIIGVFIAEWRRGMPGPETLRSVRWPTLAVYAAACGLAAWSSVAGWFVPPIVGVLAAVVGALAVCYLSSGASTKTDPAQTPVTHERDS